MCHFTFCKCPNILHFYSTPFSSPLLTNLLTKPHIAFTLSPSCSHCHTAIISFLQTQPSQLKPPYFNGRQFQPLTHSLLIHSHLSCFYIHINIPISITFISQSCHFIVAQCYFVDHNLITVLKKNFTITWSSTSSPSCSVSLGHRLLISVLP